jgi:chaperonin GroES
MISPAGHRVLVFPDEIPEKTDGGIYRPDTTRDREQLRTNKGKVIAVGPQAWEAFGDGSRWADVGDVVIFKEYGGLVIEESNKKYRIINDEDVLAVLKYTN